MLQIAYYCAPYPNMAKTFIWLHEHSDNSLHVFMLIPTWCGFA